MKTASLFMTPSPNVSPTNRFPHCWRENPICRKLYAPGCGHDSVDTAGPAPWRGTRTPPLAVGPADGDQHPVSSTRRSVGDHRTSTSARSRPVASCQYTSVGRPGRRWSARCGSPDRTQPHRRDRQFLRRFLGRTASHRVGHQVPGRSFKSTRLIRTVGTRRDGLEGVSLNFLLRVCRIDAARRTPPRKVRVYLS